MTATLRLVLDQSVTVVDPVTAEAAVELGKGLIATMPSGCEVEAIVPAGEAETAPEQAVPGLAGVTRLALARRELAAAWQLGMPTGLGGGLIHAPSLFAPLVRHDRVNENDQTVVTLWDLDAWEHPEDQPRTHVVAQRALFRRAVKYADAVVVPTHAAAQRVAELGKLGDRVRVIAGAPIEDFRIPVDDVGRRRDLGLPEGYVLLSGGPQPSARLAEGFAAVARSGTGVAVVVIDAPEGSEPAIADLAAAAQLPEGQLHVRPALDRHDRAAVFGAALAFLSLCVDSAFPWRMVESLRLGVPVIAVESPVHREVLAEGGIVAPDDADAVAEAVRVALGSTAAADRLAVLAGDRGRAFSWAGAAERVWQLHADL